MKKTASKRGRTASKPLTFSRRTRPFRESVIREMTRIGAEVGGVNLAGLPVSTRRGRSGGAPGILADPKNHQCTPHLGLAGAAPGRGGEMRPFNGFRADPQTEVTITCGVSEALVDAVLGLTEAGDGW
jgi:aminotransferase